MSLGAKNCAFWCRRSPFWTRGDQFCEHFHFLMFFVEKCTLRITNSEKTLCTKTLCSISAPYNDWSCPDIHSLVGRHMSDVDSQGNRKSGLRYPGRKSRNLMVVVDGFWDTIDDFWLVRPGPTRSRRQNFEIALLLTKNEGVILFDFFQKMKMLTKWVAVRPKWTSPTSKCIFFRDWARGDVRCGQSPYFF